MPSWLAPPHFRQLGLTEAQRNQIFDIKYKSMPSMRQHYQELRATRVALREASSGANYDAAKVRTLADKLGKLQADVAALRAADQHRIYAVLTPQQQAQLQKMRDLRPAYGTMRGPGAGFGPRVAPMGTDS
ncbi:MAG: Spy/CpxP family protein refolding chaperone [Acidihalobacter sp.]